LIDLEGYRSEVTGEIEELSSPSPLSNLDGGVLFTLPISEANFIENTELKTVCLSLDSLTNQWSPKGCSLVSESQYEITCK
jgi:hypothetical protein